ncbi:MAG: hypothetical protein RQ982_02210 [Gammaproteobacteria bacterium]|nr:hypothetical protein [Gammaproteobacteria bacterium]
MPETRLAISVSYSPGIYVSRVKLSGAGRDDNENLVERVSCAWIF